MKQFLYPINLINWRIILNNKDNICSIFMMVVIVSYFGYYSVKSFDKKFNFEISSSKNHKYKMNKLILRLVLILLMILFNENIFTQQNHSVTDYSFYNTKTEYIYSQNVADSFLILISVPDDYASSGKSYPVFYVLDGDIAFGMAASIARYLQIGDNIPELIVVGIGYGAIGKSAAEKRLRDYGPQQGEGAEKFLNFLNDELIPFIDSEYRTVTSDRTINGFSLGGLFALYTLFTKPDAFSRYIVGSPYLVWDDYSIFNYEAKSFDKISVLNLNVFISVGSDESTEKYFEPIDSLVKNIQKQDYPELILETKVFQGSTRLMGPPEALTHGLISVFNR